MGSRSALERIRLLRGRLLFVDAEFLEFLCDGFSVITRLHGFVDMENLAVLADVISPSIG